MDDRETTKDEFAKEVFSRGFHRISSKDISSDKLTDRDMYILNILEDESSWMSQTDIANQIPEEGPMSMSNRTLRDRLDNLDNLNEIVVRTNPEDKRYTQYKIRE